MKKAKINIIYKYILNLLLMALVAGAILLFLQFVFLPKLTRQNALVKVPSFIGLTPEKASMVMQQLNLRPIFEDTAIVNKNYDTGVIISQNISSGETVKENREILLTINKKKAISVTMPDLRHDTLRNAAVVLKNSGLILGNISYISDIAHNVVLEQSTAEGGILPGTEIDEGTEINLTVGVRNIEDIVVIPKLADCRFDTVEERLLEHNLRLSHIVYHTTADEQGNGYVFMTDPPEGTQVPTGSSVIAHINKKTTTVEA